MIDMQYLYDATALIAEEFGMLVELDTIPLRQLTHLVSAAHSRREKRAKAASNPGA